MAACTQKPIYKIYKIVTEIERSSIQQQNKWYSQRYLLAHFETTLDFSSIEFTCT